MSRQKKCLQTRVLLVLLDLASHARPCRCVITILLYIDNIYIDIDMLQIYFFLSIVCGPAAVLLNRRSVSFRRQRLARP